MALYGIMRVEKAKMRDCGGLQAEHERTRDGRAKNFDKSDINWDRTDENEHLIECGRWGKVITDRSKAEGWKIREGRVKYDSQGRNTDKSSVVALDAFYGASPEWFEQNSREVIDSFFRNCLQYHIDTYCQGDETRVLSAVIHWDEATPHMHVASIPLVDDGQKVRLSARDLMGGKAAYRHRQNTFYEEVSRRYGLERGEIAKRPEEMKRHQTVQEYKIAQNEEQLEQQARQAEALEQSIKGTRARRDEMKLDIRSMERVLGMGDGALQRTVEEHARLKRLNIEKDAIIEQQQQTIEQQAEDASEIERLRRENRDLRNRLKNAIDMVMEYVHEVVDRLPDDMSQRFVEEWDSLVQEREAKSKNRDVDYNDYEER